MSFMDEQNYPHIAVTKNTQDIQNKLAVRKIRFDSAVEIRVPTAGGEDQVQIGEYQHGRTTIRIRGRVIGEE
jgi:hypothetical protein